MTAKRIGSRMRVIQWYVEHHPGCSMYQAAVGSGSWKEIQYKVHRFGYAAVHRAIAAGLITAQFRGGRYYLRAV